MNLSVCNAQFSAMRNHLNAAMLSLWVIALSLTGCQEVPQSTSKTTPPANATSVPAKPAMYVESTDFVIPAGADAFESCWKKVEDAERKLDLHFVKRRVESDSVVDSRGEMVVHATCSGRVVSIYEFVEMMRASGVGIAVDTVRHDARGFDEGELSLTFRYLRREAVPSGKMALNFCNVPLTAVLRAYGDMSGKQIDVAQGVSTCVTVKVHPPVTTNEALMAMERQLGGANIALVPISSGRMQATWLVPPPPRQTTHDPQPSPSSAVQSEFIVKTNNGAITIQSYAGPGGPVVIPDTINGHPVTGIGWHAFMSCTSVASVDIGTNVTKIGDFAFYACSALSSIKIPGSVIRIGANAFDFCTALTNITVDACNSNYSSSDGVLFDKKATTLLQYPNAKSGNFYTVPTGVARIGYRAFPECPGLTTVIVGAGVTNIGGAFFGDAGFSRFGSEEAHGAAPRWPGMPSCSNLHDITVDADNRVYSSVEGVLYDKNRTTLIRCPSGKSGSCNIPSGVCTIGEHAFRDCFTLTSVTMPDSVTNMASFAFTHCSGLTNLTVGTGVDNLGLVTDLTVTGFRVSKSNSTFRSEDGVLFNKGRTELLRCPGSKTGEYAIPSGVVRVRDWAFAGCTNLTIVSFPSSLTGTVYDAFRAFPRLDLEYVRPGCSSLTAINVDPDNPVFESVDGVLFNKGRSVLIEYPCGKVGDYSVPASVTNITGVEFGGCKGFRGCTGLTSVAIPSSVTSIDGVAFSGCAGLTNVVIGSNVVSIEMGAFADCCKLTSIQLSASVNQVRVHHCPSNMVAINVDPLNAKYSSLDGVLYNRQQTELIRCPAGRTGDVTIPAGVTNIGASAFFKCSLVTNIIMPDSVIRFGQSAFADCGAPLPAYMRFPPAHLRRFKDAGYAYTVDGRRATISGFDRAYAGALAITNTLGGYAVTQIGERALFGCSNLTSVTIADGITSIGKAAFLHCSNLTSVAIPEGVVDVGEDAFRNCTSLTNVAIPGSVTHIDRAAFQGCVALACIAIPGGVTNIGFDVFRDCTNLQAITVSATNTNYSSLNGVMFNKAKTALIVCPSGKVGDYAIPPNVTTIGNLGFVGCVNLTNITIPNSVTQIEAFAFFYCSGLKNLTIPSSVNRIGTRAFRCCSSLTNVSFPTRVPEIEFGAFKDCTNLPVSIQTMGAPEFPRESSNPASSLPANPVPGVLRYPLRVMKAP